MGNIGSAAGNGRRRHNQPPPPPPPAHVAPQPGTTADRYLHPGAAPYPGQYPNPNPNPNPNLPPGYYQQYPIPAPYDQIHGRNPYGPAPMPFVEHQKAITIRNDVNLKKESIRVEKDEENPGKVLVSFNFDATAPGSITIMFFAKEGEDYQINPTKENTHPPVSVPFEPGLAQKFRQPSGTGIDLSNLEESELLNQSATDTYPLVVKAEARLLHEPEPNRATNSQITQAVFETEKGEYHVKVVKQFLWVNGTRYELQEIYGIGNSVEGETDANDPGNECVICLSEPRDTTVLPCGHMCMCSGCAKVLRFQTNRCPICRQPVERLLEIKVGNETDESVQE